MADPEVIDLTGDWAPIDRPARLRAGVRAVRPVRVTASTITSPSPCCGHHARLRRDDHRPRTDGHERRCGGCGWPYLLRGVGDGLNPSAMEWEVQPS
jgi:hypothetical protein